MAKVHPIIPQVVDDACASSSSCSTPYMTSKRETFTIWMKSLVMQGNGCTVYNGDGRIVYRIDNYDSKHSNEVYLMDLKGKVLFTLCENKMSLFTPNWNGFKDSSGSLKPCFRVRKSKGSCYKVTMPSCDGICYILEAGGKSSLRIRDSNGGVVAESRRKQSSNGVELLGDDVLSLVMEPHVDHSFVMALVTVYGLIKRQL